MSRLPDRSTELPASSTSQQTRKLKALERNNLKWNSYKDEIRCIYVEGGKTLKGTMEWFEQEHGFTWSERNWKMKLKEWKFEKNVPANEMRLMATKAQKRELEEGKDTIFYRNGILVDQNRVEHFKKQRLNAAELDPQSIPATPPHITYETPKPSLDDENPTPLPAEGKDVLVSDREHSLASLNEDQGDDIYSSSLIGQDSEAESAVEENRLVSISEPDDNDNLSNNVITRNKPDQVEIIEVSDDDEEVSVEVAGPILHYPIVTVDISNNDGLALDLINKDIRLARSLRDQGLRSEAEIEYCKAIQIYLNWGGVQSSPQLRVVLRELRDYYNSALGEEVRISACQCLGFLHRLWRSYSPNSFICTLLLSALDGLLRSHPGVPQGINIEGLMRGLNDPEINKQLYMALQLCLQRMKVISKASGSRFGERIRLSLVAVACDLKQYLSGTLLLRHLRLSFGFYDLRKAIQQRVPFSRNLELRKNNIISMINHLENRQEVNLRTCYTSIAPLVTELASLCSIMGWNPEADTLFAVLRSRLSMRQVSSIRNTEISVEYCLHLAKLKRYNKLLSIFPDIYKEIMNLVECSTPHISRSADCEFIKMRRILNQIPRPLDKYVSSQQAREIMRLDNLWFNENEGDEDDMDGRDKDESEVEGENEQLDGCRSLSRLGVTYTESVETGISFNYSDLYG